MRAIAAGQSALAHSRCEELQRLFGDRLYIELQRHGMPGERAAEPALIELAYARGIPLVATNEPFFATREDYEAHDALLCIAEGKLIADGERRQLTPEHRFKTAPKWPRCSPICRRRWRRPSRSPSAARFARARWRRSCRAFSGRTERDGEAGTESATRAEELRRAARAGLSSAA